MASYGRRVKRKKKNRKVLFAVEIVILALLTVVLLGCIWATHKLGLVNHHETDDDRVVTRAEANEGEGGETGSDSSLSGIDPALLQGSYVISYNGGFINRYGDTMTRPLSWYPFTGTPI